MTGLPDPAAHPLMTVEELVASRVLPYRKSAVYDAIKRGDLPSVRFGSRVLIPTAALRRMLGLPETPGIQLDAQAVLRQAASVRASLTEILREHGLPGAPQA